MKKVLAFLLALSVLISFIACSSNTDRAESPSATNTATDAYSNETTTASKLDVFSYIGTWSEEGLSWDSGGFLLDLSCENGILTASLLLTGSAPFSRIAEVNEVFAISAIENSKISAKFEDDNWGNSGTLTLEFLDEKILCTLSNITYTEEDGYAMWGLYDCEIELVRNENAHNDLSYTMDDYYELYPEEKPTEQPVYDTSKASGILAQAGLTEHTFRDICTYINSKYYTNNEYVYAAGRQYYNDHPDENTLLDNYTEDWVSYQSLGSESPRYNEYNRYDLQNSNNLDEYLNRQIYGPKGAAILGKQSEELFKAMREYPADYINTPFLLKDFRVESIYDYTYSLNNYILYDTTVRIIDYRDDVNYPNILNKTRYDMYVIFMGTQGSDTFVFALISVEKAE